MKYTLQCRYSMIDETFMFVIKSVEQNEIVFSWLVGSIENPIYILTNNNIILKSELENDFVRFSVVKSEEDLKAENVILNNMPLFAFETSEENLQIIYDYDHIPTEKEIIVGKIINTFLVAGGGGFLETTEEYTELENNVLKVLEDSFYSKSGSKTIEQKLVETITIKETKKAKKKNTETIKKVQVEVKEIESTPKKKTSKKSTKTKKSSKGDK